MTLPPPLTGELQTPTSELRRMGTTDNQQTAGGGTGGMTRHVPRAPAPPATRDCNISLITGEG